MDRAAAVAQALKKVHDLKAEARKDAGVPQAETAVRLAVISGVVLALLWSAGAVLRSVLSGRAAAPAPVAPAPAPPPPAEAPVEETPATQPAFVPPPEEAPAPKRAPKGRAAAVDAAKVKEIPVPRPTHQRPDGTWDSSLPAMEGVPR